MSEEIKKEPSIETETEPKILDTSLWVDEKGVRGKKGLKYNGVVKYAQEKDLKKNKLPPALGCNNYCFNSCFFRFTNGYKN